MMHKKAEELMFADLLGFGEDGRINLFNTSAFLFPTEFILKIEERVSPDEIYELAKKMPLPIIKILTDRKMEELERLDFLLELAEVFGMGNISVPNFDQNKSTHEVVITNANPNKILCHHTRGYLASVFSDSLKKTFECNETQCVSKGGENCKFTLSPKD
jgi:predicted hydrocarbon binding protein